MVILAIYIIFIDVYNFFHYKSIFFYIKIVGLYSTMLHIHTGFDFILHTRPYFARVWFILWGGLTLYRHNLAYFDMIAVVIRHIAAVFPHIAALIHHRAPLRFHRNHRTSTRA